MSDNKKGIAVVSGSGDVAFKFLDDGTSVLGKDATSTHDFSGSVSVSGTIDVQGNMELTNRIGGHKFGLPALNGDDTNDAVILADLSGANAATYNGFMFYLTNPLSTPPFNQSNKIYFCEDGTWHASPFFEEDE